MADYTINLGMVPQNDGQSPVYDRDYPDSQRTYHGQLRSVTVAGAGNKTDNNTGNYLFYGHRHSAVRATDFDSVSTSTPSSNTKAGWQAHLDGIYPILTSDDFNVNAVAQGATLQLTGGNTKSGKYLQRRITRDIANADGSYALRNFSYHSISSAPAYKPKVYQSFYLNTLLADRTGKFVRTFHQNSSFGSNNFWVGKSAENPPVSDGDQFTFRSEGASTPGTAYSDQRFPMLGEWHRVQVFLDYENDLYAIYVDNQLITDVSEGKSGWVSGLLGSGCEYRYSLIGNTIEIDPDTNASVKWSNPYMDFDFRRIEIADNAVWSSKTATPVLCPIVSIASDVITYIVNQGDYPDLENKHVFYLDGMSATYVGPLTNV